MRHLRWAPYLVLFTVFGAACALWHWAVATAIWTQGLSPAGAAVVVGSPAVCAATRWAAGRLFPDLP